MRGRRRSGSSRLGPVAPLGALALLLALLLTACRTEQPVAVAFPDDPRVLNGTWELVKTGLEQEVSRALLAPAGDSILLSDGATVWSYDQRPDGTWLTGDASPYEGFGGALLDGSAGVLVKLERSGLELTVTTLALADAAEATVTLQLPAGVDIEDEREGLAVGSGRLFAMARVRTGEARLHWWSLATGASEGSLALPASPDGWRASRNGRILSFWDVPGSKVRVVDAAAPAAPRTFDLGICRGNSLAEASDDGRWFLIADCFGNVKAIDLSLPAPEWRTLGLKVPDAIRFAHGSARVVYLDGSGKVWAFDLGTFTNALVADVGPRDPYTSPDALELYDASNVLVAPTTGGRVAVFAPLATDPRVLPELAPTRATMNLTAVQPAYGPGFSSYEFEGDFAWAGQAAPPFGVEGWVFADRFHEYRLSTAALPPARLDGRASIGPEAEPLFALSFEATDRSQTKYLGSLVDEAAGVGYQVSLEKAAD